MTPDANEIRGADAAAAAEPLSADAAMAAVSTLILALAGALAVQAGAWAAYGAVHAAVAGLAAAWAAASGRPPRRQATLLAMSAAFLGALGTGACLLCILAEAAFRPRARPFIEWYADLFPGEEAERAELMMGRLLAGGDPASGASNLVSFTDAVTNGTIEQKQAIVALIARRFSPAFAPALRKALEDPVPAVRVQAAAAAAAIEQRFSARAMKLEQAAAKRAGQAGHFRELGALYAEMADSGILEKARADAARAKALEHFRTVLTLIPDDPEALSASAKLLLDQGKPKEATQRLSLALAKTQDDAALAALLVEALMREGRFADIRNLARAARGRFTGAQAEVARLEEALAFWAAGARA